MPPVFWLGLPYTPYEDSGLPMEAQTHWSNNTHVSGISNEIKMDIQRVARMSSPLKRSSQGIRI
jgi:hypothetical protein